MVQLQRHWQAFGREREWVTIATLTTHGEIVNGQQMADSKPDHGDPYRLVWPSGDVPQS